MTFCEALAIVSGSVTGAFLLGRFLDWYVDRYPQQRKP